jgi:hypothetical protein
VQQTNLFHVLGEFLADTAVLTQTSRLLGEMPNLIFWTIRGIALLFPDDATSQDTLVNFLNSDLDLAFTFIRTAQNACAAAR